MIVQLCLRTNGNEASSRLAGSGHEWAFELGIIYFNHLSFNFTFHIRFIYGSVYITTFLYIHLGQLSLQIYKTVIHLKENSVSLAGIAPSCLFIFFFSFSMSLPRISLPL